MAALLSGFVRVLALSCTLFMIRGTAQDIQPSLKLWTVSAATLSSANAIDALSSMRLNRDPNLRESNSLLASSSGRFETGRAVGIQAGLAACILVPEYLLIRRHPKLARAFSYVNFGLSAIPAQAAIHNFGLK
jgi:hypothetical protein